MESYIIFEGSIDQEATLRLKQALIDNARTTASTKITIFFSSLGGNIYEGFVLASIIQNSKIPIAIHAVNHIDSIANVIFLAASERTCESYAKFYLHGATAGSNNYDEKGLLDALSSLRTNNSRIAYYISENSKLPLQKVKVMMKKGITISAQDALKYNIVQSVTHKTIPMTVLRDEIIYIN